MSIGYACLTVGVPNTQIKGCTLKNANNARLLQLIEHNLKALTNMIDYNIENNIKLFRISSDIIPFGSNSVNSVLWQSVFSEKLDAIGKRIKQGGIRVSMHPGQYTVLNSSSADVVKRAVEDINYHAAFLDSLKVSEESKIVLHIGGAYGDKVNAIKSFISNYAYLDTNVKSRIVIENDDKCFHIGDILYISEKLSMPVVYDILHNAVNPCSSEKKDSYWIDLCKHTWKGRDGRQKIHYSQQAPGKSRGSHSESIEITEFMRFYNSLSDKNIDVMLEVKNKNLSAVKCINHLSE